MLGDTYLQGSEVSRRGTRLRQGRTGSTPNGLQPLPAPTAHVCRGMLMVRPPSALRRAAACITKYVRRPTVLLVRWMRTGIDHIGGPALGASASALLPRQGFPGVQRGGAQSSRVVIPDGLALALALVFVVAVGVTAARPHTIMGMSRPPRRGVAHQPPGGPASDRLYLPMMFRGASPFWWRRSAVISFGTNQATAPPHSAR
jgi:hypothetical protein